MTCLEQGGCSEYRIYFFFGVEFSVKAVLLCKVRKKNDCHSEEVRTQPSITTYQHIKPTDISNSYFCQSFVWDVFNSHEFKVTVFSGSGRNHFGSKITVSYSWACVFNFSFFFCWIYWEKTRWLITISNKNDCLSRGTLASAIYAILVL